VAVERASASSVADKLVRAFASPVLVYRQQLSAHSGFSEKDQAGSDRFSGTGISLPQQVARVVVPLPAQQGEGIEEQVAKDIEVGAVKTAITRKRDRHGGKPDNRIGFVYQAE
jgi:hypothetical protein